MIEKHTYFMAFVIIIIIIITVIVVLVTHLCFPEIQQVLRSTCKDVSK
jgi:phosphotransferase system  glucose/maltose/N-acetylglucosamine-specific IIC component